jgi:hypothetical protein
LIQKSFHLEAVEGAFSGDIDYAMLVKITAHLAQRQGSLWWSVAMKLNLISKALEGSSKRLITKKGATSRRPLRIQNE